MAKLTDPDSLTYSVNGSTGHLRLNTTAKTIQLVADETTLYAADGVTGQCLFSKIKEVIKASSALISRNCHGNRINREPASAGATAGGGVSDSPRQASGVPSAPVSASGAGARSSRL